MTAEFIIRNYVALDSAWLHSDFTITANYSQCTKFVTCATLCPRMVARGV